MEIFNKILIVLAMLVTVICISWIVFLFDRHGRINPNLAMLAAQIFLISAGFWVYSAIGGLVDAVRRPPAASRWVQLCNAMAAVTSGVAVVAAVPGDIGTALGQIFSI